MLERKPNRLRFFPGAASIDRTGWFGVKLRKYDLDKEWDKVVEQHEDIKAFLRDDQYNGHFDTDVNGFDYIFSDYHAGFAFKMRFA